MERKPPYISSPKKSLKSLVLTGSGNSVPESAECAEENDLGAAAFGWLLEAKERGPKIWIQWIRPSAQRRKFDQMD